MAVERRPSDEIQKIAVEQGMTTLWQDGLAKVAAGMTSHGGDHAGGGMSRVSRQLGESLVNKRLLSRDVLEDFLVAGRRATGVPLAKLLVVLGHVTDGDLLEVVAEQLGIELHRSRAAIIQPDALDRIDARTARQLVAVPISAADDGVSWWPWPIRSPPICARRWRPPVEARCRSRWPPSGPSTGCSGDYFTLDDGRCADRSLRGDPPQRPAQGPHGERRIRPSPDRRHASADPGQRPPRSRSRSSAS